MQVEDRLFLNPFAKCQLHGKFPWSFTLHILLVIMVTSQVLFYTFRDVEHAQRTIRHFSKLFMADEKGKVDISQPSELQRQLHSAIHGAFYIRELSVAEYRLKDDVVSVLVQWREKERRAVKKVLRKTPFVAGGEEYLQGQLPFLFGDGSIHEFKRMKEITLELGVREPEDNYEAKCLDWSIQMTYDGAAQGEFHGNLLTEITPCGPPLDEAETVVLNLAVSFLALASLLRTAIKATRSLKVCQSLRQASREGRVEPLTCSEMMPLFSKWWALTILANIVQMAASMTCLRLPETTNLRRRFAALGWSSFFTWITLCQYFEHFPRFYTTFHTMSNGVGAVTKFMISVVPIFFAFGFLGLALFWQTDYFSSPAAAYASLFSLLNGDMIHDGFNSVGAAAGWMGYVYVYVFIFLFIYIILNVNITIIEEAFFAARFDTAKHDQLLYGEEEPIPAPPRSPELTREWTPPGLQAANPQGSFDQTTGVQSPRSVGPAACAPVPHTCAVANFTPGSFTSDATPHPHVLGATPSSRATARAYGRMSPRFLGNPKLQGALAAAFPREGQLESGPSSSQVSFQRSASTRPLLATASLLQDVPGSPGPVLSASGSGTSLQILALGVAPADGADHGNSFGVAGGHAVAGGAAGAAGVGANGSPGTGDTVTHTHNARMAWWSVMLPEWTQQLRQRQLPRRYEVDDAQWRELERLLADLGAAVDEANRRLHREHGMAAPDMH